MANIKANIKSIITNEKRRIRNNAIKSRVKTAMKKAIVAFASNDAAKAQELVRFAHQEIANARNKGVFHSNTAARKSSRLDAHYNKIFKSATA